MLKLPPIPASLNTIAFGVFWEEYIRYRAEKRNKLTPIGAQRLLNRLASWGEDRATAALDYSMGQGWIGVFEENTSEGRRAKDAYASLKRFAKRHEDDGLQRLYADDGLPDGRLGQEPE